MNRFSLNHATTKHWNVLDAIDECARLGIGIGLWRDSVAEAGIATVAAAVRDAGVTVTSLCRGGFLTDRDGGIDDNRAAIEEAAQLGTRVLVMVCGGIGEGNDDIEQSRDVLAQRLRLLVPHAREHGVQLAIEPLHPMFASDRSVVSTLDQALDIAEPYTPADVGVVIDTYHVWWDPTVWSAINRAGRAGRIAAFQVADWVTPLPEGVLTGRGQLGDGCVPLRRFQRAVDAAGYRGPVEVELFNDEIWARPGPQVLDETLARYRAHVEITSA